MVRPYKLSAKKDLASGGQAGALLTGVLNIQVSW
jgi:hypothetical protein